MKKYKFEYRGVSRLEAFSGNSCHSRFHRRVQIQQFLHQIIQLNNKELDWDFERRHQVIGYGETQVRKMRRLHVEITSWHFWTIRSQSQGTESIVKTTNVLKTRKSFGCDLGWRNEPRSCGQRWLWMPRWIKSNSMFWSFFNVEMKHYK